MCKRPYPKILLLFSTLLVLILLFAYYSGSVSVLQIAQSIAGNKSVHSPRILIATQGSAYKNALVEGVTKAVKNVKVKYW